MTTMTVCVVCVGLYVWCDYVSLCVCVCEDAIGDDCDGVCPVCLCLSVSGSVSLSASVSLSECLVCLRVCVSVCALTTPD